MENLKILVVEDNEKHLKDAKKTFDLLIKKDSPIEVHYAETLKEAEELIEKIRFDGVISDVFFPYDKKTKDDNIYGWDYGTAGKCRKVIKLPYEDETLQKHEGWMIGEAMHPSGMLVALECNKKDISFVFETDQTGHGSITEAVLKTVSSGFGLNIWNQQSRIKKGKKWYFAFSNIISQVWLKKTGLHMKQAPFGNKEKESYLQHIKRYCSSGFVSSPFSRNDKGAEFDKLFKAVHQNQKEIIAQINS